MQLIKPSYQIIEQKPGLEGIYEQIELAGRTCYKSQRPEGKTAKDFVDMLIKNKHYAMLEHGTVYLKFYGPWDVTQTYEVKKYIENPYSKVVGPIYDKNEYKEGERQYSTAYITTNLRVLQENNWIEDLQSEVKYNKCYLCEPTEYHEKRVTVHFITSIGIGRELLRHRKFSFANESTRYCNYSKDKFDNEIQCIIPSWSKGMIERNSYDWEFVCNYNLKQTENLSESETRLIMSWCYDEAQYLMLLNKKIITPQQAREVLPLATKSELVMTGFISDWQHVFNLRSSVAATGQPHPDMKALIDPLMQEFIKRNYINE